MERTMPNPDDQTLTPNQPFPAQELSPELAKEQLDETTQKLSEELQKSFCPPSQTRDLIVCRTKGLRRDLDQLLQIIKSQEYNRDILVIAEKGHRSDANMALWEAEKNLKQTIMWLGMMLKSLNTENPYPHSYDPGSKIIDPTADGLKL